MRRDQKAKTKHTRATEEEQEPTEHLETKSQEGGDGRDQTRMHGRAERGTNHDDRKANRPVHGRVWI